MTQVHPLHRAASSRDKAAWDEQHVVEHTALWRKTAQLPLTAKTLAQVSGAYHLAPTGYETSPAGVIRQWGGVSITTGTPVAVTFYITFPNNVWSLTFSLVNPSAASNIAYVTSLTTAGFTANVTGAAGGSTFYYQALGD